MDAYEYVNVTFGSANVDQVIPFVTIKPSEIGAVRWMDVTPTSATSTVPVIYRSTAVGCLDWGAQFIVLRSTVASYSTRLLLFLERA
jgi:hypothetical protein